MSNTKAVEQRIEEIRNRLAEITPGPWMTEIGGTRVWHLGLGGTICTVNFDHQTGEHQPGEDQEFIANAPSDIAFLLDQLASIPAQIEAAKAEALGTFSSDPSKAMVPLSDLLAAVQAEREACAMIADEELESMGRQMAERIHQPGCPALLGRPQGNTRVAAERIRRRIRARGEVR